MTHEFQTLTRDIANRLRDLQEADDWRAAELADQIAHQAERLDRLARGAGERPAGKSRIGPPVPAAT